MGKLSEIRKHFDGLNETAYYEKSCLRSIIEDVVAACRSTYGIDIAEYIFGPKPRKYVCMGGATKCLRYKTGGLCQGPQFGNPAPILVEDVVFKCHLMRVEK